MLKNVVVCIKKRNGTIYKTINICLFYGIIATQIQSTKSRRPFRLIVIENHIYEDHRRADPVCVP